MDSLQSMRVFVQVAQLSGFSAAARQLRLSTPAVTKHVAALEERLGVRLLERTTRRVRLSEAGEVYLERCLECLQAIDDADAAVSHLSGAPQGVVKLAAPTDFQVHMGRVIHSFVDAHPQVAVDLRLSNRSPDLVEEGFDLGIDVRRPVYTPYVSRLLFTSRLFIWGSRAYLRAHGRPQKPADLAKHRHLVFSEPRPRVELAFAKGRKQAHVRVTPVMMSNVAGAMIAAAVAGLGLFMCPTVVMADHLAEHELEPVLEDWQLEPLRFYVFYPARRYLPAKVRAFIDALRAYFGDDPETDRWSTRPGPRRLGRADLE